MRNNVQRKIYNIHSFKARALIFTMYIEIMNARSAIKFELDWLSHIAAKNRQSWRVSVRIGLKNAKSAFTMQ